MGAGDPTETRATDDRLVEVIHATGHEHVAATHDSTLEVTTDDYLTPAGDCILAVEADRAPADFGEQFVAACRRAGARIQTTFTAGGHTDTVVASGSPELLFDSDRSAVWRTSDYVDDRTVAVAADAAASDLDRSLVEAVADGAPVTVEIAVTPPE